MANIAYEDCQVASSGLNEVGYPESVYCTLDGPQVLGNALILGSDGENALSDYYTPRVYIPQAGCPFCGQVNLTR